MMIFYMNFIKLSRSIGEIYQFHGNKFLFNQVDRYGDREPQVLYVVATRHQVIKGFKNIIRIPVGASATSGVGSKKDTGYLYKPSESRARINTPCPSPIYRPLRLLSNLGANCLLPMQKRSEGVRKIPLVIVGKRPVCPKSGQEGFLKLMADFGAMMSLTNGSPLKMCSKS
jgi:hypothetical protein